MGDPCFFPCLAEDAAGEPIDERIAFFRAIENELILYGPVEPAVEAARYYDHVGKYELDISKARRLMATSATPD
jgi:hypothetical protein